VAVTVLPTAAHLWMTSGTLNDPYKHIWQKLTGTLMTLTNSTKKQLLWIMGLICVPLMTSWFLLPALDYLPPVKRDAVDGFFSLPPGATTDSIETDITDVMVKRLQPYMDGEKEPKLKNYYFFAGPFGGNIGVRVEDQSRVKEMETIINEEITVGLPDVRVYAQQGDQFCEDYLVLQYAQLKLNLLIGLLLLQE